MVATIKLVKKLGGEIVSSAFLAVLDYLPGRKKLDQYPIFSLINYEK